ncbi:TIGR03032 family protein [Thermomonas sp.]|uniref:TIGR03032 family protein n=1 Tax=Thermomonas sp. TaxID=1971895 RepID=UPI0026026FBE|nr:TIGR03032 family protein [Thermomonas sp.]MCO5055381.1 TIGR03032 family protein [Thermomonas sp.]HRO64482.1 TIGR03032 family protein [Thermomonas sp.]
MAKDKKQKDPGVESSKDAPDSETGLEAVAGPADAPPAAEAAAGQPAPQGQQKPKDLTQFKVERSCSRSLAGWLAQNRLSLAITSYQSGRIYLVGSDAKGRVSFFERIFERAMGVIGNAQRIYLGGLYQLWRFENVLRSNEVIHGQYDKCYVPRNAQTIGDVDIHELGIRKNGRVVFVNTKYSCLAELDPTHSFKAIWKPTFISKLAPEDRCHLNGLAMVDGEPKYVTAVCKSDTVDGWRERRSDGGIVIDVSTDEIVCEGLSMPHSPRWHDGKLWLLNAGTGYLGWVDFEKKAFVPHAFVPGFARGLSIIGNVAAVGLSKPRNQRFEGLQLDEELKKRDSEPWCGVQIISLTNGDVLNWIRLDGDITEIFDISFLPNVKNPMMIGLRTAEIRDLITFESSLPVEAPAA